MKKLNLKELKVNSFVTAIDGNKADTAKGGGTQFICSIGCTYHLGCQPQTHEFKCSLVVCPTNRSCASDCICPEPVSAFNKCNTEAPVC